MSETKMKLLHKMVAFPVKSVIENNIQEVSMKKGGKIVISIKLGV